MTLYQDCSSCHDLWKNMAARAQGLFSLYIYIENFKNLLVRNYWTDFNIIQQKCSYSDLLPRLFKPSWFVKKNMAARWWGLFSLHLYRKISKSSRQKLLEWFQYNFAGMLPWWHSTKIFRHDLSKNMTARSRAGLIFPIYVYICLGDTPPRLF